MPPWLLSLLSARAFGAAVLLMALSVAPSVAPSPVIASGSLTFTVNSAADDADAHPGDGVCATAAGVCTLRAAIQEANAHAGPDTIAFNIPGSGVQTIQLGSVLPTINDSMGGVTIDGYTQPEAAPNTDPVIDNAKLMVQLRGTGLGFNAFTVMSANNVFRGLAVFNVYVPFYLTGPGANYNRIVGDFVGTDATGTFHYATSSYDGSGINLYNGPSYNQIGDVAPADRNVISGNAYKGIALDNVATGGPTTDHNVIYDNIVGLSPSGGPLGNLDHGIDMDHGFSYNIVGGTAPGQRNVLSGNGASGIELSHPMSTTNNYSNQIIGNFIGTDVTGSYAYTYTANAIQGVNLQDGAISSTVAYNVIGNSGQNGISVYATTADNTYGNVIHDNRIGVTVTGVAIPSGNAGILMGYLAHNNVVGPSNVVANNPVGFDICCGAKNNTITQNSIYANTSGGIYIASGNNGNVQPPVIAAATTAQVTGTACASCAIEVFVADAGAGVQGQGKTYLATGMATASGAFTVSVTASLGACLTATATNSGGSTSAFATDVCTVAATATATTTATDTTTPTGTATSTALPLATDTPVPPTGTPTSNAASPTATGTPVSPWTAQSSGITTNLRGVTCPVAGTCFAVGDYGVILGTSTGGTVWTRLSSGTGGYLKGIGCSSAASCLTVGDFGIILGTTNGGNTWISQGGAVTSTLYSVACPSATTCLAVGAYGAIEATNNGGASWSRQNSGTSATLYSVACLSAALCVTAGISGTILVTTNGGATWVKPYSPTTQYLYSVTCATTSACYAVGGNGMIVVTTNGGSTWSRQSAALPAYLRSVACTGVGSCNAVGDGGTIVASMNGSTAWGVQASGTTSNLRGVACDSTGSCYAVGDGGTIVATGHAIKTIFLIVLENENWSSIVGNPAAPYLNGTLLPQASYAQQYYNPPGLHPSLPNYLWLEAGTNFGVSDDGSPAQHPLSSTAHLTALLDAASVPWVDYQESITGTACPLSDSYPYAVKHDAPVYFTDINAGNNPAAPICLAHVRPYAQLASDLTAGRVGRYNLLVPNLCDDMHDSCAPLNNPIAQGDAWLAGAVPLIQGSAAYRAGGLLLLTWDEAASGDGPIGLLALSEWAKGGGYHNALHYTHSATLRTVQEVLGVGPLLGDAANAPDLRDLFTAFP